MLRKLLKSKKLLLKYWAVLLLVLCIPLSFSMITLKKSTDTAMKYIVENNYHSLIQIQKTLDKYLDYIKHISFNMAENLNLMDFEYDKTDTNSLYDIYQLQKSIQSYTSVSESYIEDICIYIKEYDLILTSDSHYTTSQFYDTCYQFEGVSADEFRKQISKEYFNDLSSLKLLSSPLKIAPEKRVLVYMQSFPFTTPCAGNIMVFINYDNFVSSFSDKYSSSDSCFYALDKDKAPLFTIGNDSLINNSFVENGYYKFNDADHIAFVQNSDTCNVTFVSAENMKNLSPLFNSVKSSIKLYIIWVLLVGVVITLFIALKSTKPIIDLSHNLKKIIKTDKHADDLAGIKSAVDQLITEKIIDNRLIEEQLPIIEKSLIHNIVHGNFTTKDEILSSCSITKSHFRYPYFCVASIELNFQAELQKNDFPLIKYALSNLVTELFEPYGDVYMDDDQWLSCVALINLKSDTDKIKSKIKAQFEVIQKLLQEEFIVDSIIGVGSVESDILNTFSSYTDSKNALDFGRMTSGNGITLYDEIRKLNHAASYPLEKETLIIKAVLVGDVDQAKKELDIIAELCSNSSIYTSKCIFYGLIETGLKLLSNESLAANEIFEDYEATYNKLASSENICDLKANLYDVFDRICDYIRRKNIGKKERIKNSILEYVNNNFQNPNMSLEMVASEFSFSYTYLSHFFKVYLGINFSNYVMNLRIEKAVQYLKETDWSIAKIAEEVGYANGGILIKNFKKIKKQTPTEFRESIFTQNQ